MTQEELARLKVKARREGLTNEEIKQLVITIYKMRGLLDQIVEALANVADACYAVLDEPEYNKKH